MIKEELKQEAEEKAKKRTKGFKCQENCEKSYIMGALDFAEPREKRIAELEAEVKEWKDKAELWCKTANLKDHNIMINKELEKENADLKEEINKIAFARGNLEEENAELKKRVDNLFNSDCWASDQLAQAKEIINQLLGCLKQDTNDPETNYYVCQYMDKAEQFLNSEVEKCLL